MLTGAFHSSHCNIYNRLVDACMSKLLTGFLSLYSTSEKESRSLILFVKYCLIYFHASQLIVQHSM